MIIYVGDSKNLIPRIRTNHCSGNVEGSALRRHVAKEKGYRIKSTKRASGKKRVRIDLPNPLEGEKDVSNYIRSGKWKYVICNSDAEAKDFQWYAIEQLEPLLNKDRRQWDHNKLQRYKELVVKLTESKALDCGQLRKKQSGPGVYILYHQRKPKRVGKAKKKMRIYITHCTRRKDDSLRGSSRKVVPNRLYTAKYIQRFMRRCIEMGVNWAIFSDLYGVWFPNERQRWYTKPSSEVTDSDWEFRWLLYSFNQRLQNYDEIWFYYCPSRIHPLYLRLLEETTLRDRIRCFTHYREIE